MEQSIFRIQKDSNNPYVMVNKQLLNNTELSWKGKGLLTYLLSLPDNWKIYEDEIVKHAKDGKDSLKSAIKELIENGYIERERIRNSHGQLKGYSYCVYEIPTKSGLSIVGKSNKGESATTNNNLTKNDRNNNKTMGSLSDDKTSDKNKTVDFVSFVSIYKYRIDSSVEESIERYTNIYKRKMKENHPNLTEKQWKQVVDEWLNIDHEYDDITVDAEIVDEIVDIHFATKYTKGNYNIMHFISGEIRKNRFHEWQRSGEAEEG